MNCTDCLTRDTLLQVTRRQFLRQATQGLGALWLASMGVAAASPSRDNNQRPFAARSPHRTAKASRIIYLHMAGAPSQLEMFDYKPELAKLDGRECPREFLEGKRF